MFNIALVSDFDGTISKKDFFWFAIDNLLKKDDIKPWNDYENGKITHVEALRRIFAKISIPKEEFNKFSLKLPIEESFVDTIDYCKSNNIDVYIVSAGADYYIKNILSNLGVLEDITLITNPSLYSEKEGLKILETDKDYEYYSDNYGISKKKVVESLKNKYDQIIYAGDGAPDFEACKQADVVFARGRLLKLCEQSKIITQQFVEYYDILNYLQKG